MTMRHLLVLCSAAFALAACNGGEDFSDATVPGCPIGAQCEPSSRGNVLVELVGPAVANLGYECGNSLNFTSDEETTTADGEVTIPPFNAVCPANAKSIEFFLGSRLASPSSDVTHNSVTLGRYLFPQRLPKGRYQVTLADLVDAPTRISIGDSGEPTNEAINRAALLQALDTEASADHVTIPDEAHEFIDTQYNNGDLVPGVSGYSNYSDFTAAWDGVITGVGDAEAIAGFDADIEDYRVRLQEGNSRTRAGLYVFEASSIVECLLTPEDCEPDEDSTDYLFMAVRTLVLPGGEILSGGKATTYENSTARTDFIGFDSSATFSETLELMDADSGLPGGMLAGAGFEAEPNADTSAEISGKVLGQTIYSGPQTENGNSDYKLDFPTADHALQEAEKGRLEGELVGAQQSNPVPLRATKTALVQTNPNTSVYADLQGEYTLRLMRACVDDDLGDDEDAGVCSDIPDPSSGTEENEEIDSTPVPLGCQGQECSGIQGNYPELIGGTVKPTEERVRQDIDGDQDICLTFTGEGLVTVGVNGACGPDHVVGFVTRTFDDPASANVTLFLAPGLDLKEDVAHYGAYIEGRIDLDSSGDGCRRMYRLSDDYFELGVRAKWEEAMYLPTYLDEQFGDEPTAKQSLRKEAVASGAVQFFKNGQDCDPLATP